MRNLILIVAVALMFGCATPPGQLKESDFVWQEKTVAANYQEVYRNVNNGFRKCALGVPQGSLYTDIKKGHFDVFHSGGLVKMRPEMTRTIGQIEIISKGEKSSFVKAGANTYDAASIWTYIGTVPKYTEKWLRWASGDLTCG